IYFAMLTLPFAQIVYAVVHQWDEVTGGDNGVLSVWPVPWLAGPVGYYYWALAVAVVGLVALRRVTVSPFGLALRAARDHPRRAEAVGVDIRAHQLAAFVVAAFFAGLGGATFVYLKGSAFPSLVDAAASVQPLVMVLLGGVESFAGPLAGAAVYKVLDTLITRVTDYWSAVLGVVLLVLVIAFPRGGGGALGRRTGGPPGYPLLVGGARRGASRARDRLPARGGGDSGETDVRPSRVVEVRGMVGTCGETDVRPSRVVEVRGMVGTVGRRT